LASTVLLLLVVGVPVWLALADGRPSIHVDVRALWQALEHRRPGDIRQVAQWLGQAAVLLAWIAWAWLTLCVVLEVVAWRSGRSTVHLPASRSIQFAAALLVGAAFAVGSLGRFPAHGGGTFAAVPAGPVVPGSSRVAAHVVDSGPISVARAGGRSVGADGAMEQPVDQARRVGAPAVPGSDPAGLLIDDRLEVGPVGSRHTVAARESLWSIAAERLGSARRWRDIAALNYGRGQVGGGALGADHWLQAGWELLLPIGTGPSPSIGTLPQPDPSDGVAHPHVLPVGSSEDAVSHAGSSGVPGGMGGTPLVPVGTGIVGIGVADLVDRLRKVQQRHRVPGGQIRLPEQLLRPFEQRLRLGSGSKDLEVIEAAVVALADGPDGWPEGCRLTGATVDDGQVRLAFDAPPSGVTAPFTPSEDGNSLIVDRAVLASGPVVRRADRRRFAAPTLVTVGRTGGVLAMVALEGLGAVTVAGDPVAAEGLGRAMALELASSRWASAFDLVLVGFGAALASGEAVTVVGDPGPVIADLTWRRLTMSMRLDDASESSLDAARRSDRVGDWRPIVVVCAPVVPPGDVAAILELASDGRLGICAVAMDGVGGLPTTAGHVLHCGPSLQVAGAVVETQAVDRTELDQATRLIATAAQRDVGDDVDAEDPDGAAVVTGRTVGSPDRSRVVPYGRPTAEMTTRVDPAEPGTVPAAVPTAPRPSVASATPPGDRSGVEVEVAILGTVEVRGAARGFTRAWALELVVYLAMHPGGASNEVWSTALWPDRLMAPSSLHSTASVARRSLGRARDGADHLPRSHGRLALASTVGTDWGRFQALATSDDPDRWEEALTIVRGRPFDGIRSTDWSLLDGTAPSIESAVVDLSGRLAGARLRSGDPHGAEWAARKGLLVSPYDERLYRMLLRTADAAGNPEGVETVMAELVRIVADEVEPVESVHPSTLALYRSLSRRSRSVLDVPPRR
jgi:hypothetical protein